MRDLFIEGLKIHQHLETNPDGTSLVEADWLFFPEIKTLGSNPKSIQRAQEKLLLQVLEDSSPTDLSRRIIPESEVEVDSISLLLEPPRDLPLWGTPLKLEFPFLWWSEAKMRLAYVPCLGVEIPISEDTDFETVMEEQIRFAINRRRINRHLFDLSLLQRCTDLDIETFKWNTYPLSPKERAMKAEGDDSAPVQILSEVGQRIDNQKFPAVFEREDSFRQIASLLKNKRGASSILLIGESGVGKSAIIQHFSSHQEDYEIHRKEVFYTPGSKIVAGMSGFGEWQDRCRKMAVEASTAKGKILYFGNLMELLDVGQSASSSENVGSFFRPWLVRGQFIAIAECTPAQLTHIEQKDPRILAAFRQIQIAPPNRDTSIKILREITTQFQSKATLSTATIRRIFSLHQRYAGYSSMPGKMIHFANRIIEQNHTANTDDGPVAITPSIVNQAFALETGLPEFLLNDASPLDVEKVHDWFQRRIKGQEVALRHVIDSIASIKARLTRPNRPLASFLFVGPTGVGKTELAKTLAEFFYGSPDRMIRIDMSEYSVPGSSVRLASGGPGEPEGILTSKLRDQPFSVVLLDEFEKADASVYDLFLQVLGEARLTDGTGRLADFSNAIIILTSNLGAAEYRAVAPGFASADSDTGTLAIDHFVAAAKKKFRPEFFNRIGKIVPFLPLDEISTHEVIGRELLKIDRRDGFRNRELTLFLDESISEELNSSGFDPRYGARPLKRKIEEVIIAPISQYLISSHQIASGSLHGKRAENGRLKLHFQPDSDSRSHKEESRLETWRERTPNMRRWYQFLSSSHLVSELHSEAQRIERQIKHRPEPRDHERLAKCQSMIDRLGSSLEAVLSAEEKLLLSEFKNSSYQELSKIMESAPQWPEFCDLLRDIYLWVQRSATRIVLLFSGDDMKRLVQTILTYREAALEYQCRVDIGYYRKIPEEVDLDPTREGFRKAVLLDDIEEDELLNGTPPENCAAIGLEVSRNQVGLRFALEGGVHRFIDLEGKKQHVCITYFDDDDFTLKNGFVSEDLILNHDFSAFPVRRIWNYQEESMKDEKWGSSIDSNKIDPRELPSKFSSESIHTIIEMTLIDNAIETIR